MSKCYDSDRVHDHLARLGVLAGYALARWGQLMTGALLGSVPVALVYSFFVEYYVTGLTGSVKG
jgi:ABC-type glycerol-3-phosphate transport system permease component